MKTGKNPMRTAEQLPMLTLLKNIECFCPVYRGKNDILISSDKICKIQPEIRLNTDFVETYDCTDLFAFPGIIDQHLHITGGGGEEGFESSIPEIGIEEILNSGITTVVGVLGADGFTKTPERLYAKAKALESFGLTTYIYSGSYTIPPTTITGSIINDLIFVDKVIGIKIALSDHRSNHSDINELIKIASQAHLGGMLSGKAGVLHIHIGDGKRGISPLIELLNKSDLPKSQFVPTHINRNYELFVQAKKYCRTGGNIDLTSGETKGISVPDAVSRLIKEQVELNNVTISSDANGSIPGGGAGSLNSLYDDIVNCIKIKNISAETAFSLATKNVARILKLSNKGQLAVGNDADILITDKDYKIKKCFAEAD
jgi:beta-aspartyl-dipeptidase (metallo-type)